MADSNLQKIFNELNFSNKEREALAKCISIIKTAKNSGNTNYAGDIESIIKEVANNEV